MFIGDRFNQVVTIWNKTAGLTRSGEPNGFAAPVKIIATWILETNLIRNSSGEESMAKNKIFLEELVNEGDFAFLGDALATADPVGLSGAVKLKAVKRMPSVDGDVSLQVALG